MSQRVRILRFVVLAALLSSAPLQAQDQFGRAVAVGVNEVLVLKPSSGRGLASVYAFRRAADGRWAPQERVHAEDALATGEGLSPSLEMAGGMLLVASGDPDLRYGAHVFRRGSNGRWERAGRIPLRPGADSAGPRTLDLAGLFQILRPPRRTLSADGDVLAIGVAGGPAEAAGVHLYRRDATGSWVSEATVTSDSAAKERVGSAVALAAGRLLVGAPNAGAAGEVWVYVRDGDAWREEGRLAPDSAAKGSRFGAAVAWAGEAAIVGMPGTQANAGRVLTYGRGPGDTWSLRATLSAPAANSGDGFGAALAVVADELVVGAPLADSLRGRVYRFGRDGAGAPWRAIGVPGRGEAPGDLLGSAVALSRDLLAVGAPGADGNAGRVAVYSRVAGGGWASSDWLVPEERLAAVSGGERRCDGGHAAAFSCHDVDLEAFLPIEALGGAPGEGVSDIWGWTDPETKREYALVGRTGALVFVDVTNPSAPVRVGEMPANRSGARDIKVYKDHAFLTGDGAGDHGLMVFDLTRLRGVTNPPETFEADTVYHEIASAHNLVIDTGGGFAYPVGASGGGNTCGGGLHMVDIRDPERPTFAGCYTDTEGLIWKGRTHDAQCVVYRGPDTRYAGKQICFASNETALRIVDVTEKDHPVPISAAKYPGMAYVHQGWLTDDQRYFFLDDELDELVGQTPKTRTLVWDVAELDDPVLVTQYLGSDGSTDHNLYIKGDRMYQANYQAGLRVVDVSDPSHPVEVGFFDTTPYDGNPPGFSGAWTAFPYFDSGTVIVSSMREGLFILRPRPAVVP